MDEIPDSIKHPDTFHDSQLKIKCPYCDGEFPFDGIFNWKWALDCFNETGTITPMDFDGVVERHYHYLVFESKAEGVNIPLGQRITLDNLKKAKSFTIIKVWGKDSPTKIEIDYPDGSVEEYDITTIEDAKEKVRIWYQWADRNKT